MKREVLEIDGREVVFSAQPAGADVFRIQLVEEERLVEVHLARLGEGAYRLSWEGQTLRVRVSRDAAGGMFLVVEGASFRVRRGAPRSGSVAGAGPSRTAAPTPGIIRQVLVAPGDSVKRGQIVILMEAMKMECPVAAGKDGTVARTLVEVGKTVDAGTELMIID